MQELVVTEPFNVAVNNFGAKKPALCNRLQSLLERFSVQLKFFTNAQYLLRLVYNERQRYDASDTALVENNELAPNWGCNPF